MINNSQQSRVPSNFFTEAENTKPYFKAGLQGLAGSGKTYTSALIAKGLHARIKSEKPVVIFDTEKAAKFLKPMFAEAKIPVLVRESKSLTDLMEAMRMMREEGLSDILIIDSISHVWENFLGAYKKKIGRANFQFQDWGLIKPAWKESFSDPFVGDPYHIIMCGRAGYEYGYEMNEDTHKKELRKTGIKMKVEGETAYEPDLLIQMERFQEMEGNSLKRVIRTATVIKDRSTVTDGKVFENPTYEHFAPAVEVMLSDPFAKAGNLLPEGDPAAMIRTEEEKWEYRRELKTLLEEIEGLLNRVFPSSVGKDRANKLSSLDMAFGTTSETAMKEMRPDELREGFRKLMDILVEAGSAYWSERDSRRILNIGKDPAATPPSELKDGEPPESVSKPPKKKDKAPEAK